MRQYAMQTTLPKFALVTEDSSSDSISKESPRSRQVEVFAHNTKDIVAQLHNTCGTIHGESSRLGGRRSCQDRCDEGELIGDKSVQTSSRMSLTYVCEGSESAPSVQAETSENDQT